MADLVPVCNCDNPRRSADIVFVHGLNGNSHLYWCHGGKPENSWPAWLGEDLPNVSIWSLSYENAAFKSRRLSFLSRFGFRGFAMPLTDRAKNVLHRLGTGRNGRRIGEVPLVFVAHSMGGLLVKQMLRTAHDSDNPRWQAVLKQTRGICFIATPHIGADMAKWATYFRSLLGVNVSVDELRPHEPFLRDLKEWYSNFVVRQNCHIQTISFYEMKPTLGNKLVVEPGDANPGVPNATLCPLDESHSSICKPESKNSDIYCGLIAFLDDCALYKNTGINLHAISKTLLWVHDYPIADKQQISSLEALGWKVTVARSNDEAMGYIKSDTVAIVVTRLGRLGSGGHEPLAGIELARRISENHNNIHVIVFPSLQPTKNINDKIQSIGCRLVLDMTQLVEAITHIH